MAEHMKGSSCTNGETEDVVSSTSWQNIGKGHHVQMEKLSCNFIIAEHRKGSSCTTGESEAVISSTSWQNIGKGHHVQMGKLRM
jgi:hypothetical protein